MEHVDDILLLNHLTHTADGTEGATTSPTVPGCRRKEAADEARQGKKAVLTQQHIRRERSVFSSLVEEAHGFVEKQLCRGSVRAGSAVPRGKG